ncbi:MarR family winged helix-turn-helix transcriptional regulator [Brevibacillus ginsengisoli]|uniref:MarR family winged helix-turn-helix transcriptional regulator n=1 Tax=Brevibacillus ginsengisoli TaxID=363854 RepID=UPI003CF27295
MEGFELLRELIFKTNQLFIDIITEELVKSGITRPQILVLEQIKVAPKTIGDISRAMDLSYSTVSGIVDRLERDGLVQRNRDEKDRRVVWVSCIDNLPKFEERLPFMEKNYFPEIFEGIKPSELEQVNHSLELISTYLEKKRTALSERGSEKR